MSDRENETDLQVLEDDELRFVDVLLEEELRGDVAMRRQTPRRRPRRALAVAAALLIGTTAVIAVALATQEQLPKRAAGQDPAPKRAPSVVRPKSREDFLALLDDVRAIRGGMRRNAVLIDQLSRTLHVMGPEHPSRKATEQRLEELRRSPPREVRVDDLGMVVEWVVRLRTALAAQRDPVPVAPRDPVRLSIELTGDRIVFVSIDPGQHTVRCGPLLVGVLDPAAVTACCDPGARGFGEVVVQHAVARAAQLPDLPASAVSLSCALPTAAEIRALLPRFEKLRHLVVTAPADSAGAAESYAALAELPLRALTVSNGTTEGLTAALPAFTHLESLHVKDCASFDDAALRAVEHTKLRSLVVVDTAVTEVGLLRLARLPSLRSLGVSGLAPEAAARLRAALPKCLVTVRPRTKDPRARWQRLGPRRR